MKAPTTHIGLLERIRSGDPVSWREFHERYQPFVAALGRCRGLSTDECEELVQLVMIAFFGDSKRFVFDPSVGRFHTYLGKIIRNRSFDLLRKRQTREKYFVALELEHAIPVSEEFEERWQSEYRLRMLSEALEELKPQVSTGTWQAYELYVIEQRNPEEVARHLNMTTANVYNCKARCEKKIRRILQNMGYEA